jgi:hypothetical protein
MNELTMITVLQDAVIDGRYWARGEVIAVPSHLVPSLVRRGIAMRVEAEERTTVDGQ